MKSINKFELVRLSQLPWTVFFVVLTSIACPPLIESVSSESLESASSMNQLKTKQQTESAVLIAKSSALQPGKHCYQMRSDFINMDALLTVDTANDVTGQFRSFNHFVAGNQFSEKYGAIDGNTLNLYGKSEHHTIQETWSASPNELYLNDEMTLQKADCTEVSQVFESKVSKPKASSLQPGEHCYQMRSDFINMDALLGVDAANGVTAQFRSFNHYVAGSEFSTASGTIDGNLLNLYQEYGDRTVQETWEASPQELYLGSEMALQKADCNEVSRVFDSEALTASANHVRTERVKFGAGRTGTMVNGAVVRGDRTVYIFHARSGQQVNLSITSVENNAVFDLVAPDRSILSTGQTQKDMMTLPQTGDYRLIVGGTRGNTNYDLAIAIK